MCGRDMEPTPSAESFWDSEIATHQHVPWMDIPAVREYILRSIADEGLWPTDWLKRSLNGRRLGRALSIGCGTGALERDLVRKDIVGTIDALDGSTNSLRVARETAVAEGMIDRIRYFAADFNEPALPRRTYDAVFIHQAAHHVAKLEKLFRAILRTLKPGGMLYLDEFVGPTRHHWNDETVKPYREIYASLPDRAKRAPELSLPVMYDDPSEAIRSDEILPQLRVGFDVEVVRGYGGNLLAVLAPWIDPEHAPGWIERLIEDEKRMLAAGADPFYALIVARPMTGLAGALASARYFVEPKVKRVGREIRARL
jgi:SAM-dependent methyltransferase